MTALFPGDPIEEIAMHAAITQSVGECTAACGRCGACLRAAVLWRDLGESWSVASGLVRIRRSARAEMREGAR